MTFYTFTRTDSTGPFDYPTLGFSAVNGAVLDGSLFNPPLTSPPDAAPLPRRATQSAAV